MVSKWRRKEKARKAKHEQGRQSVEDGTGEKEENREAEKSGLGVTPSMDVPEAMISSPIDVEEVGEPSELQGNSLE